MIIPNKYSGYQAGIRLYPGGGGGGGGQPEAPTIAPPPPRMASAPPPPAFQTYGNPGNTGSLVQAGAGMRPAQYDYSRPIYDPNYADNVVGYERSAQFYQPIQPQQYQNYNMGNPMSISQYGQGFGGFNPYMPQMQTPFNPYTNSFGYGGYGMQSPFSFQPQFQPQMGMGMQTPFSSGMSQPAPQRVSSGPAQAIVSRSAGLRGTPNVMRRAEGGITSLMDAE